MSFLLRVHDAHDRHHARGIVDEHLALLLALGLCNACRNDRVELGDVELGLSVDALLLPAILGLERLGLLLAAGLCERQFFLAIL